VRPRESDPERVGGIAEKAGVATNTLRDRDIFFFRCSSYSNGIPKSLGDLDYQPNTAETGIFG
jgi:hypothetical protein